MPTLHQRQPAGRGRRTDRRRPRRPLLRILALPLIAVSCGLTSPDEPQAEVGILDELLGRSDGRAAHQFVENEIAACMQGEGFDYTPEPIPEDGPTSSLGAAYFTVEFREVYGFGMIVAPGAEAEVQEEAMSTTTNDRHLAALDDAEWDAWIGQEAICFEQAWTEVESRQQSHLAMLSEETTELLYGLAFRTAPALQPAMDEWSICMGERGFDYPGQLDMHLQLEEEIQALGDDDARMSFASVEREVALADLACDDVHLGSAIDSLEAELEQSLARELNGEGLYDD